MGNETSSVHGRRPASRNCGFSFTRIAAVGDTAPDGSGTYTGFAGLPATSGDSIAFIARESSGRQTIYVDSGGARQAVVDSNAPVPGGTDAFTGFGNLCLDGPDLLFLGRGGSIQLSGSEVMQQGVYVYADGVVRTIADINTPVPGGSGNFRFPTAAWIADGFVTFTGSDEAQSQGVYGHGPSGILIVADSSISVPGRTDRFQAFGLPTTDGKNVAFQHPDLPDTGIYIRYGTSIEVLVDTHTPIPNGGGATFKAVGDPHGLLGKVTVFNGFGGESNTEGAYEYRGIYCSQDDTLSVIADANTPIPDGQGNFYSFPLNANVMDPTTGDVAFEGEDEVSWGRNPEQPSPAPGQKGIFMDCAGRLHKVIDLTDTLDGKPLTDVSLGNRGLSGNQLVISATFVDGSSGIYCATVNRSP
jgi:hypothetical protein